MIERERGGEGGVRMRAWSNAIVFVKDKVHSLHAFEKSPLRDPLGQVRASEGRVTHIARAAQHLDDENSRHAHHPHAIVVRNRHNHRVQSILLRTGERVDKWCLTTCCSSGDSNWSCGEMAKFLHNLS
jgi:hypothetical protein